MTAPLARKKIVMLLGGLGLLAGAGQAAAAAFALQENSGSGLGNAYAGGAAAAEDASTVWFNPAGMSHIGSKQVVGAVNGIKPSIKFGNNASQPAANQPLGDEGGDAGSWVAVPNLYLVVPLDQQWALGLGVNAPFGMITEYDSGWIGRFQAIKSQVKTYNINPAVSYKIGDLSLGAGASYQHIQATFTSAVNYSGALLQAAAANGIAPTSPTFAAIAQSTPGLASGADINGSDSAWGWNLGALYDISKDVRVGVAYRSAISYTVSGNINFSNPAVPSTVPPALAPTVNALATGVNTQALYNSGVSAKVKLPQSANLSYFQTLNDQFDVMADLQWTGWSSIQDLTFVRTDGTIVNSTPEHFKDVWRVSVGGNYHLNDNWMFRGGLAYDQTPIQDQYRTPRVPDEDRYWLALGAQYRPDKAWRFDLGGAYIWVSDTSINLNGNPPSTASYGLINGNYNNSIVIVSGQVTYSW